MRSFILVMFLLVPGIMAAEDYIFSNGKTSYKIALCDGYSASEQTAATELAYYVQKAGEASLPIVRGATPEGKTIYIGFDNKVAHALSASMPDNDDDGYSWITKNGTLFIFGGKDRGTMYGVFQFLEKYLGIEWYTKDFTKIPARKQLALPQVNHHASPAFNQRNLFYYNSRTNPLWSAHNLLNSTLGLTSANKYGGQLGYNGVHTMGTMVPADKYFSTHPEYYALRNGRRIKDGQLCLSNANVLKLLKEATLKTIAEAPGCWCYSVSQNDNQLYCECSKCTRLERKYGGHSGLMLWAVNQIADEVKARHPGVLIGTLAYQYTQQPPTGIKPRDNVVIRLCDIESCFGHPLSAQENLTFRNDMSGWSRLTDKLYVWDYATNFAGYLLPFPNYHALAANLRWFQQTGVAGVMEEGQYESYGGEFCDMKQWILANLLWNPEQDVDSLARRFIIDYYGKAADDIYDYYLLCNGLNDTHHLMLDTQAGNPFYTDRFIKSANRLLSQAASKVQSDGKIAERVEEVRSQLLYLQTMRDPAAAVKDGNAVELRNFLIKSQWNTREGQTYKMFLQKMDYW